ncbi:MAG: transcription elongation factor GreA [Candidatus Wildermuthbacteria bacterium]|nr:transcription elongation factor GreA [Candidatus Wildermuthbacteria bacterium]
MLITKEGLAKLKKELEYLKGVKQKELVERLRRAIALGDLSENFDYHNAREEQDLLDHRVSEIEDTIANSSIAPQKNGNSVVQIGSVVTVETGKEKMEFTITGPQEADPMGGKISAESPLGLLLLGKKKGDAAQVQTPSGSILYKILEIR